MEYNIATLLEGLSEVLSPLGYDIYISNRQQGVKTPCFFISLMPSTSQKQLGRSYFQQLSLDIVFLQDPNIINATDGIYSVIQFMDENLELIPYIDGEEEGLVHTYDRSYQLQEMDLHYHLTFKNRVYIDESSPLMKSLEVEYEIKVKQQ